MKAYIKGISYYLPPNVLDNESLNLSFPEWSVEKISAKTGIFKRHIASADMFSSDMGILAAQALFREYSISPSTVDFVLFCSQSPDYFLPTTACILQEKLNIPTSAGALDFNLGCSGYIYGLGLAKGLIYGGIAKNVLLITAETYSKFINDSDKSNKTIFGDAAAATLISANDGFAEIGNFDLGTDGKGAENLIVKRGGAKYPKIIGDSAAEVVATDRNENFLFMNGGEIFEFTMQNVPSLVANVLAKNDLKKSDVDLFVFHQANKYMLNRLRKKIDIPEEKFYFFLESCGNTVSSTIPIAIKEACKVRAIKEKGKLVTAGFGVGYSWGGTVLYF